MKWIKIQTALTSYLKKTKNILYIFIIHFIKFKHIKILRIKRNYLWYK